MEATKLKGAKYFAVTPDFWTSIKCTPFMSFTLHFIDSDRIIQSYCLDSLPLYEDHTREITAAALKDVLDN